MVNVMKKLNKAAAPLFLFFFVVFSMLGLGKLTFTNDFRSFFSLDNPKLAELKEFENVFVKQENIVIVLEAPEGQVYSASYLSVIRDITNASWKTPYSIRVNSISNYQYLLSDTEGLEVLDALPLQAELNDNDVSRLKDIVKDDADLIRTLLSDNTGIAVINIQLALPENDMFASTESVAYVREMIEPYRASGTSLTRHPTQLDSF
jgi:predicted RND superfamily exporter protein